MLTRTWPSRPRPRTWSSRGNQGQGLNFQARPRTWSSRPRTWLSSKANDLTFKAKGLTFKAKDLTAFTVEYFIDRFNVIHYKKYASNITYVIIPKSFQNYDNFQSALKSTLSNKVRTHRHCPSNRQVFQATSHSCAHGVGASSFIHAGGKCAPLAQT